MRLGAYPCALAEGTRSREIYGADEISERHRHRFEVNPHYRDMLIEHGMTISGTSPDGSLVEMVEISDHPWFLAGQFHPELKSRPTRPHPLFASFVEAAARYAREDRDGAAYTSPLASRNKGGGDMFDRFMLIAGPCVLEDDALNLAVARSLLKLSGELKLPVIFKASFDKANRAKLDSQRGPGLEQGLERLAAVKAATGLPILTDIHEASQAATVADVADVIQIPAFLCRQTDLLVAAGETGRPVNVKKGQWMAPEEMSGAVDKLRRSGASEVAVTERGTALGYGDLVVDMRSFDRVRAASDAKVFFDGTHSVQRPGR